MSDPTRDTYAENYVHSLWALNPGMPYKGATALEYYNALIYLIARTRGRGTYADPNSANDTGNTGAVGSVAVADIGKGHRHGYNIVRATPDTPELDKSTDAIGLSRIGQRDARPMLGNVACTFKWGYDYGSNLTLQGPLATTDWSRDPFPGDATPSMFGLYLAKDYNAMSVTDARDACLEPSPLGAGYGSHRYRPYSAGKTYDRPDPIRILIPPLMAGAGSKEVGIRALVYNPSSVQRKVAMCVAIDQRQTAVSHTSGGAVINSEAVSLVTFAETLNIVPCFPTPANILFFYSVFDSDAEPNPTYLSGALVEPFVLLGFQVYEI